jgi:hypothetical protein
MKVEDVELQVSWFIVLLFAGVCTHAQEVPQTKKEIWPEIDVFFPVKDRFRLVVVGGSEKDGETNNSFEGQAAIYLDYFLKDKVTLRAGYRYGFSLGSNEPFNEHRIVLDQTLHKPIPRNFVLSDRNREEFRWFDADFSMRYRNRAKVEKTFAFSKRSLVPYVSGEVFYDTRFSTFNRFRLATGTQIVFAKREFWLSNLRRQRMLDVYYVWQRDSRSQSKNLHAIGVTFEIHF